MYATSRQSHRDLGLSRRLLLTGIFIASAIYPFSLTTGILVPKTMCVLCLVRLMRLACLLVDLAVSPVPFHVPFVLFCTSVPDFYLRRFGLGLLGCVVVNRRVLWFVSSLEQNDYRVHSSSFSII
jgi:hypothetical protein